MFRSRLGRLACGSEALASGLPDGPLEINGLRTRKDGSKYWSNAVLTPVLDDTGAKRGFVELSRDITQHKHR